MSATDTQTLPPPERITIVLQAQEGGTLKHLLPFLKCGDQFAAEGFAAMIAGVSEGDLQMLLGQERDDRQMQAELQQQALGTPAHLAAHAQEMFDLLRRIDAKCGGLGAALGHGIEPSEQMWAESREAMEAIWELQDKIQSAASVDKVRVNQISETSESVNQTDGVPAGRAVVNSLVARGEMGINEARHTLAALDASPSFSIDDHVRLVAEARRYRWLRDVAFGTPRQDLVPRDSQGNLLIEQDLDGEIDHAMKAYPGEQEADPCAD